MNNLNKQNKFVSLHNYGQIENQQNNKNNSKNNEFDKKENKELIIKNSKSIINKNTKQNINDTNYLYFLVGFLEGEGSNSISISVNKTFKFGVNLQSVFNVSQHVNGISILNSFLHLFGVGSVLPKSGSPDI